MTFRTSLLIGAAAFVMLALVIGSGPTVEGQGVRGKAALMNPANLEEQAPAVFKVNFDTTAGSFVVEVHRDWAPVGADHFHNLVKRGFYDECRFIVVTNLTAHFGAHGDPEINKIWLRARILDDPPGKQTNKRGTIAFATAAVNRRSTEMLINLVDNPSFDIQIRPFGEIVSGMNVVEKLYSGYGDWAPVGEGPNRNRYRLEGNAYLEKEFPKMDYIKTATIVP